MLKLARGKNLKSREVRVSKIHSNLNSGSYYSLAKLIDNADSESRREVAAAFLENVEKLMKQKLEKKKNEVVANNYSWIDFRVCCRYSILLE